MCMLNLCTRYDRHGSSVSVCVDGAYVTLFTYIFWYKILIFYFPEHSAFMKYNLDCPHFLIFLIYFLVG